MSTSHGNAEWFGWRLERQGAYFGLSGFQLSMVVLLAAPVLLSGATNQWGIGLRLLLIVTLPGVLLVVIPVRGKSAVDWVRSAALFVAGRVMGWSFFRAAVTTSEGSGTDQTAPDLPGRLSGLVFHEGPPTGESMTPVCVIHDPATNRWTAVAKISHPGLNRDEGASRDEIAAALGRALAGAARGELVGRLCVTVREVPDDGTAREAWLLRHRRRGAPEVAEMVLDGMERTMLSTGVRYEAFVAVAMKGDASRKASRDAGGGPRGRALVLYRLLQETEASLQGVGVSACDWLDTQGVAQSVRTGFDPTSAMELGRAAEAASANSQVMTDLPLSVAGPATAPSPSPRSYTHDAFVTVSYAILMPTRPTKVGTMKAMLSSLDPQVRRSLSMHYEPIEDRSARRQAESAVWAGTQAQEMKQAKGFRVSLREQRRMAENQRHEKALSAGHAGVRVGGVVAVTVPSHLDVADHTAALEADARRAGYILRRLELAQDTGFIAAVLPLAIGLPDRRTR